LFFDNGAEKNLLCASKFHAEKLD